jgi:stage V sporulation protein B
MSEEAARKAGRGGLAVTGAKIYFILLGMVQQVALPRVLGLDGYGALSRVLSIASVAYNPLNSMSIQGVSRAVAHSPPELVASTVRSTLRVHALLSVFAACAFFLLSPAIARFAGAAHVEQPLRALSAVLLLYGLYTPLVGVVNGQRRFLLQAAFDVAAATLRTAALLIGAYAGARLLASGVLGATLGFVLSALAILVIAAGVVGLGKAGPAALSTRDHLAFVAPVLVGQSLLNLLLQADLTLLGRFASEAAYASGAPASHADALVGAYRATQLFSFLPYQLLIALTFVLFPMLAAAERSGDRAAIARYVQTGMRLAVLIAGAMVSITVGLAPRLLALFFGARAAELGGRALSLLALGFGAFAIFGILTAVLNSLGRQRHSALVTALAVALVVALCFARVRGGPLSEELLWRTAQATSAGLVLATALAALLVRRAAGALLPLLSALRVSVAFSCSVAFARWLEPSATLWLLLVAASTPLVYGSVLIVTRELTRRDLELAVAVVRRKPQT